MKQIPNIGGMIRSEDELVVILSKTLEEEGYRIRLEVANLRRSADLVATRGRWVTFVEAKLKDWRRGLRQCRCHEQVADYICLAVAVRKIPSELLIEAEDRGYGILQYDSVEGHFSWIRHPSANQNIWRPQRRYWSKQFKRMKHAY